MIYAVIMAGGKGTRFWPLSREAKPKQLLPVAGEKSMLFESVKRLSPIIPPERVIIVTGEKHKKEVHKQLPDLPTENIIAEPVGRNTAPCIALAAQIVLARDKDAVMAVFPSDHLIADPPALINSIESCVEHINAHHDHFATIGIDPSYAETGYGYIAKGDDLGDGVFAVREFCEKPEQSKAEEYFKSGDYLWNAGMFFWRADTLCDALKKHMPELVEAMIPVTSAIGSDRFESALLENYKNLPAESIDYGLMEKVGAEGKVITVQCDPGWNDVGSWRSLYDVMKPDKDGNRSNGDLVAIDSTGLLVHNLNKTVAVVGVDDLIVVETDDAILVCHKDKSQDVRRVIEKLKEKGRESLL